MRNSLEVIISSLTKISDKCLASARDLKEMPPTTIGEFDLVGNTLDEAKETINKEYGFVNAAHQEIINFECALGEFINKMGLDDSQETVKINIDAKSFTVSLYPDDLTKNLGGVS